MAITYKKIWDDMDVEVPVLHKVVYGQNKKDGMHLPNDNLWYIESWLELNCRHLYYHSPGYTDDLFIEFEDDEDAIMFALRWS